MTSLLPVRVTQAEILWHAAMENCGLGTNELPLCCKLQLFHCSLNSPKRQ